MIIECEKHHSDTTLLEIHGTDEHIKVISISIYKNINITGGLGKASLRKWHRTEL